MLFLKRLIAWAKRFSKGLPFFASNTILISNQLEHQSFKIGYQNNKPLPVNDNFEISTRNNQFIPHVYPISKLSGSSSMPTFDTNKESFCALKEINKINNN